MTTIREILKSKPASVWSVSPSATIYAVLEMLAAKDIGAVPVVQDGKVVGMFSERDYARKVILRGRTSRDTRVEELMSRPVLYVRPEQTTEECMAVMTAKKVRHLPVLEDGRLIGLVTIGDVVKHIIEHREFVIEQLANYIKGGR
ncbi:MAG: CBS domain-containing protein [Planctomycetota bacterium]